MARDDSISALFLLHPDKFQMGYRFKLKKRGTSLEVQWLRLHASSAGARVLSLVGELRSHMPQDI